MGLANRKAYRDRMAAQTLRSPWENSSTFRDGGLPEAQHGPWRLALLGVLFVFLSLVSWYANRRIPFVDEALFSSPVYNTLTAGHFGTTIADPSIHEANGRSFPQLSRYTYWCMPMFLYVKIAWHRVAGFSLFSTRLLSILLGVLVLGAWFVFLREQFGRSWIVPLALLVICLDHIFLETATIARMDILSYCFSAWAYATYLMLRRRSLNWAALASLSCVILSGLTHPAGGVTSAGALLFIALFLDRRALRVRHLLIGLIPAALGALLLAYHASANPSVFWAQIRASMGHQNRLAGIGNPLAGFEFYGQSIVAFFGRTAMSDPTALIKLVIPAFYVICLAVFAAWRPLRTNRQLQLLTGMLGVTLLLMALIDAHGRPSYFIHAWLFPPVVCAAVCYLSWAHNARIGLALALGLMFVCSIQTARTLHVIRADRYHREYLPVAKFVKQSADSSALVMASAEYAFELGFGSGLLDDPMLGFKSGKKADRIVMDETYRDITNRFERTAPEVHAYIVDMLRHEYREIGKFPNALIYRRRGAE